MWLNCTGMGNEAWSKAWHSKKKNTKKLKYLPNTLAKRHQSSVRADSIPLVEVMVHLITLFFIKISLLDLDPLFLVLEDGERENVAGYITHFNPTFGQQPEAFIFWVESVTIYGTYYKADSTTILLAEMSHFLPYLGLWWTSGLCETCYLDPNFMKQLNFLVSFMYLKSKKRCQVVFVL